MVAEFLYKVHSLPPLARGLHRGRSGEKQKPIHARLSMLISVVVAISVRVVSFMLRTHLAGTWKSIVRTMTDSK